MVQWENLTDEPAFGIHLLEATRASTIEQQNSGEHTAREWVNPPMMAVLCV